MKSINIIACGQSARNWDGKGESLGVNDCEKIGKPVDKLVVVNWANQFPKDRLKIICESQADFYTQLLSWQVSKPGLNLININRWRGYLVPNKVNFSSTSPFVAISLAWTWGYQEITLWGVDMIDHKTYAKGKDNFDAERMMYRELVRELAKDGVKVYLGCEGSALDFIPVKSILLNV